METIITGFRSQFAHVNNFDFITPSESKLDQINFHTFGAN